MQNYSGVQKFLHDFVLSNKLINKSLFELEKFIFLKNNELKDQQHIFITGLPRSGTTSILNFLYATGNFASLKYKNMPFVLSPHLSKFFNKKNIPKKQRLHEDGIDFDINSPEAFDEIFFDNDENFIRNELVNYIKLILLSENKNRYLSKNNLNFKRINMISSIIPSSIFIIPIREPLQHAYSLLNQHRHFRKLQLNNDFIRRYMNYLHHKEFGLDHESWNSPIDFKDSNVINYWLEQWNLFYKYIFKKYRENENCHFLIYEELINPNYARGFLKSININFTDNDNLSFFKNSNKKEIDLDYSREIYEDAKNVYIKFKN